MTLQTQLLADLAAILGLSGEVAHSVTYTPSGGAGTAINAVFVREPSDEVEEMDGTTRVQRARLLLALADVADPSDADTVTVGSVTWAIERVDRDDLDGAAVLGLVLYENVEKSGPDYRIRRP